MSKCIVITGGTGSGKTTLAERMVSKVKIPGLVHVYDINEEEIWEKYNNYRGVDPDDFLGEISGKAGFFIFEDASGFFDSRSVNKDLRKMLVAKRHNKQFFILLFHSLAQLPTWILPYVDTIILGNTRDKARKVCEFGYPELEEAFEEVRVKKQPYLFKYVHLK